jgi:hypothetical protein
MLQWSGSAAPAAAPRRRHRRRLVGHRGRVMLARAGIEVDLGRRTATRRTWWPPRAQRRYLPDVELPERSYPRAPRPESAATTSSLAVPAAELPAVAAAHAPIPHRAASSCCPRPRAAARLAAPPSSPSARNAWAVGALAGPAHAADARASASLVLPAGPVLRRQVGDAPPPADVPAETRDVVGVELCRLRQERRRARAPPPPACRAQRRGAAAGKVFAESTRRPPLRLSPETFAGLAGAGDLVATVLPRARATAAPARCSPQGVPAERSPTALGRPPRPSPPSRCSPRASRGRRRRAGARARRDHRRQRRRRRLDGVAHRAQAHAQARKRPRPRSDHACPTEGPLARGQGESTRLLRRSTRRICATSTRTVLPGG